MNITYTSKGQQVTAIIVANGKRFALWLESSDGMASMKVEDTVAELIDYLLYVHPEDVVCSCGTPLDADGKCARETELDAGEPVTYDGDTEEFTPLWAEPMVDQPSFPHEGRPEAEKVWFRGYAATHSAQASAIEYRNWTGAPLRFATIAVRYILSQQS